MNGLVSVNKAGAPFRRPGFWPRLFHPLRKIPAVEMNAFSHPLPITGLNLHVMSFNIRRGTKRDGKNHWIFRRNRVSELLDHYRPDVLGLQEALDFQIAELSAMLPGYEKVGLGNRGGGKGLHTAIFFDAVRFALFAEGTFWFSDTPDLPGSRGWGNIIPRTCTWVRLIEKKSGRAFYFYNVHLDHLSQRSRKNSVVLLTNVIHSRPFPDPFVLTGDFNARERSRPIQYLKGKIPLKIRIKGNIFNPEPFMDTFRVRYPNLRHIATFHGFRKYFFRFRLDYIFVPSSAHVQDAEIIQPQGGQYYPSDHFPLSARIDFSAISATADSGEGYFTTSGKTGAQTTS